MKAATATDLIDVQALRVGMFVHLDVGWMSHPFPLSSFRITTPAQVATIRSLGLRHVRWSPQQSVAAGDDDEATPSLDGAGHAANDPGGEQVDAGALGDTVPGALGGDGQSAEERALAERRRRLERQRAAEELCQRQYAEAARACRHAIDLVPAKPQEARAQAEALTRAIAEKMTPSIPWPG